MKYTDEQQVSFTRAKDVYLDAIGDGFRDVRPDLQLVFAWQDAYIEAFAREAAKPEELERFVRQAEFVREQREAEAGVGAVDGVPFFPGFDATADQELRFQAAASMYAKLQHIAGLQPELWVNHEWIKKYIRDWRWKRAHPHEIGQLEKEVARVRTAWMKENKSQDVAGVEDVDEIGWWPGFGPSDESKKTFELASTRLDELLAWGVASKLPHRKLTVDDISKYRAAFTKGDADLSHLGGYKNDVESLAKEAAEKGFVLKGGPLPSVDVEAVSAANAAAAAAVQAQKNVSKALAESAEDAASGLGRLIGSIPTPYKIAIGVGGLGLLGVAAAAFGKERGRR